MGIVKSALALIFSLLIRPVKTQSRIIGPGFPHSLTGSMLYLFGC